jgi:hypothetical protein
MRTAAALCALLVGAAASAASADYPLKGNTMATAADLAAMFQKQGPRLFEGGEDELTELELGASRLEFRGLVTVAPQQARSDVSRTLPVIVLSQQTSLRAWEVPAQYNLVLAVAQINSGTVHLIRPLLDPKDEEPVNATRASRPPMPQGVAAQAVATKANRFGIAIGGMPSGKLAISAIAFDVASNTATVELTGGPGGPGSRSPATWTTPNPDPGLPTFAAPVAPVSDTGLNFEVVLSTADRRSLGFRGGFSKLVGPHESLPSLAAARDNGIDRRVTAVVALTILVLGLDGSARMQPLAVPVYGTEPTSPGRSIAGQFAVTVPVTAPLVPGHYAAYVFMDGTAYGPQKFQAP